MSILVEIGPALSPLWKGYDHSLKKTWILFTKRCLRPSLVEIGKFYQCNLCNFDVSSPWKKGVAHFINKLESSSSNDAFCNVCWIGPVVVEKKISLILSMYFCYFNIIFPLRLQNINWQDWNKYPLRFSSVTVQTMDITVQWADTN